MFLYRFGSSLFKSAPAVNDESWDCITMAPKGKKRKSAGQSAAASSSNLHTDSTLKKSKSIADLDEKVRLKSFTEVEKGVEKCLKDNYADLSHVEIHLRVVDGYTLFQRLVEAKTSKLTMGKYFHEECRNKYKRQSDISLSFSVVDESQPKDAKLEDAMKAIFVHPRNLTKITTWLATAPLPNQRNMMTVYKCFCNINPNRNLDNVDLHVGLMVFIKRTGAHDRYPKDFNAMKPIFEEALLKQALQIRKEDSEGTRVWWEGAQSYADIIVPKTEMDKICRCQTKWLDVRSSLEACLKSAPTLCRILFAKGVSALQSVTAHDLIVDAGTRLVGLEKLTPESIGFAEDRLKDELKKVDADLADTFTTRVVMYKYRDIDLTIDCNSNVDHWQLVKSAVIKTKAIQCGLLEHLFCENDLAPMTVQSNGPDSGGSPDDMPVVEALIAGALGARSACLNFLPTREEQTSANIQSVFERNQYSLIFRDRFIRVEAGFFKHFSGTRADEKVHSTILGCFPPDPNSTMTIEASVAKLATLKGSKLMDFAGISTKVMVQSLHDFTCSLQSGQAPRFDSITRTTFIQKVRARMANFCRFEDPDPSGTRTLVGEPAAQKMASELQAKAAAASKGSPAEALTHAEVKRVLKWSWLLSPGDQEALQQVQNGLTAAYIDDVRDSGATEKKNKKASTPNHVNAMISSWFSNPTPTAAGPT